MGRFITRSLQKASTEIQFASGGVLDIFWVQIISQGGKCLDWERGGDDNGCAKKEELPFLLIFKLTSMVR